MKILKLTCSLRPESHSTRLADVIVSRLRDADPDAAVIERNLALIPQPHVDSDYVAEISSYAGDPDVRHDLGSLALSDKLIAELESADMVVIGTPMHNFTTPSALKSWIDHVVRVRRTFSIAADGKVAALADRPVLIGVAAGGFFSGENANQPDFLTPYLTAILKTIGLNDVRFVLLQGMVYGPEVAAASWESALAVLDLELESLPVRARLASA